MRIITRPGTGARAVENTATVAQVSYSGSKGFGAVAGAGAEGRVIPVFAPRGIAYRPREGDRMLLVRADGADICVGCLCPQDAVNDGELLLCSTGGARILLKNNGEISLNGLIISRDGRLARDGGETA
jgi:hypothetical protein